MSTATSPATSAAPATAAVPRLGGWWLAEEAGTPAATAGKDSADGAPAARFPEHLSDEQREFQLAVRTFIESDVTPRLEEIDADTGGPLVPELLRGLGALGFFQAEIPEDDGGLGLGLFATIAMIEELGRGGSFHVAAMVHQGIGTQPIAYYGTPEQRAFYLPRVIDAAHIGAYALTEPGSGSDALALKTTAEPTPDGAHFILNGTKQFITNAAWADYFTLFAKVGDARVGGEHVTAFVVHRDMPGFEVLAEEHKMGIKGSSTCPLRLTNVKVPAANLLGEIGKGHKIALNLLNLGRLKLGTTVLGANKYILRDAVRYACERRQFGTRIADFGMSRMKIAECAALVFAGESIAYRTAGMIEDGARAAERAGAAAGYEAKIAATEAFSPECAAVKVFLSESGCLVADHCLQLLGGYGFIEEYATARAYRDARIARLYEGTNEINRLHIVSTILRRASKGEMGDWMERVRALPFGGTMGRSDGAKGLREHAALLKGVFGRALDAIVAKLGDTKNLKGEQELTSHLADIVIETYAAESCALRAEAAMAMAGGANGAGGGALNSDVGSAEHALNLARVAIARSTRVVRHHAEAIAAATLPADRRASFFAALATLTAALGDTLPAERAVAEVVVKAAQG